MGSKQITFLGDAHGAWDDLERQIRANPNSSAFIQVGDFGVLPGLSYPPNSGFSKPVYFIDGNHENHSLLDEMVKNGKHTVVPNGHYVPRGTQLSFYGMKVNCLGGAKSVTPDGPFYSEREIPNYKDIDKFFNLSPAPIFVTHTCPKFVMENFAKWESTDPTEQALENLFYALDYKPSYWFFGHFHRHFDKVIEGTRFICIPCVHDYYYYRNGVSTPIEASEGFTLNLDNA